MAKKLTFREQCEEVADALSIDVVFFNETRPSTVFEDDGALHIVRRGVRACFGVENDDPQLQNEKASRVLAGLKIPETKAAFVDEDDERDCCPHCGEPL